MALQLCNEEYKRAKSIFASVAVARGCKNYNLLAVVEQGQLEYWRFHQAELCTVPTGENLLLGEAFGAGGVNSAVSRGTDAWQDPAAGGETVAGALPQHAQKQTSTSSFCEAMPAGRTEK